MCLYPDCDGDAVLDALDWATVRDANPDYPEEPSWGTVYPMHGRGMKIVKDEDEESEQPPVR